MRDKLLKGVEKLCWMFPQLNLSIRYSEMLSQDEVDAFSAFVNGHVHEILQKHPSDVKAQEDELSSFLDCSCGLSMIHRKDVVFVESLLSAASGGDSGISSENLDLVGFLRSHRRIWWSLHNAYCKILKNDAVGTCPIVVSDESFFDKIVPFARRDHDFQEFNKLFHESIHFILEENGVCFGDEEIDEGLVTYLHGQVMGMDVCIRHYTGDEGKKYLRYASIFEKALEPYPRSAVIPVLQRLRNSKAL